MPSSQAAALRALHTSHTCVKVSIQGLVGSDASCSCMACSSEANGQVWASEKLEMASAQNGIVLMPRRSGVWTTGAPLLTPTVLVCTRTMMSSYAAGDGVHYKYTAPGEPGSREQGYPRRVRRHAYSPTSKSMSSAMCGTTGTEYVVNAVRSTDYGVRRPPSSCMRGRRSRYRLGSRAPACLVCSSGPERAERRREPLWRSTMAVLGHECCPAGVGAGVNGAVGASDRPPARPLHCPAPPSSPTPPGVWTAAERRFTFLCVFICGPLLFRRLVFECCRRQDVSGQKKCQRFPPWRFLAVLPQAK